MAKVKWSVSGSQVDAVEPDDGFEVYEGPVPPAGVYAFKAKFIRYEPEFSSGNSGLKMLLILDPKGDKAKKKYAGAPLWEQLVDVPQNAWKLRQFMDAIGASGKDWDKTILDKEGNVVKFGSIKVDGLELKIQTRTGANQNGDARMEANRFLPLVDDVDDDDDEYDDDEDSDADEDEDDTDDDGDEDDADDDDDDDDSDDDDDDDDDDDEPEPPARRKGSKKAAAPAKKAAKAAKPAKKAAPAKAGKKAARRKATDEDAPF